MGVSSGPALVVGVELATPASARRRDDRLADAVVALDSPAMGPLTFSLNLTLRDWSCVVQCAGHSETSNSSRAGSTRRWVRTCGPEARRLARTPSSSGCPRRRGSPSRRAGTAVRAGRVVRIGATLLRLLRLADEPVQLSAVDVGGRVDLTVRPAAVD